MRTIPVELLVEIFRMCLDADDDLEGYIRIIPGSSLWTLTQICTQWRNVASTQPAFWQSILVDVDELYSLIAKRRMRSLLIPYRLLDLKRSRNHPLHIEFRNTPPKVPDDARNEETISLGQNLLGSLLEHRQRWRSFILRVYSTANAPIPSAYKHDFHFLESFQLLLPQSEISFRAITQSRDVASSSFLRVMCCSPSLEHVQIPNLPSDLLLSMPLTAFGSVTHFVVGLCTNLPVLKILQRSAETLTQIDLRCISSADEPRGHPRRRPISVLLPNLLILQVARGLSGEGYLVNYITTPKLTVLTIWDYPPSNADFVPFIDLVKRSECRIKIMDVGAGPMVSEQTLQSIAPWLPLQNRVLKDKASGSRRYQFFLV
ncbi:hypothetical protein Moror_1146 [Moniliophthora roreri MCA 2997]|uniref:F-box domain-containing protein n=2 Tax=Moniliophthora roreri TaxID=221103 RepID=V2WWG1_MONRO|nr:hypothetical protein Moror_1146 [Moniliophthora roreri MCA 2997]KAI3599182.1 hypothetical protein WG66_013471 [Moniliophthora roreri]